MSSRDCFYRGRVDAGRFRVICPLGDELELLARPRPIPALGFGWGVDCVGARELAGALIYHWSINALNALRAERIDHAWVRVQSRRYSLHFAQLVIACLPREWDMHSGLIRHYVATREQGAEPSDRCWAICRSLYWNGDIPLIVEHKGDASCLK